MFRQSKNQNNTQTTQRFGTSWNWVTWFGKPSWKVWQGPALMASDLSTLFFSICVRSQFDPQQAAQTGRLGVIVLLHPAKSWGCIYGPSLIGLCSVHSYFRSVFDLSLTPLRFFLACHDAFTPPCVERFYSDVYILRNYFFRQSISYMLAAKLTVSVCDQIWYAWTARSDAAPMDTICAVGFARSIPCCPNVVDWIFAGRLALVTQLHAECLCSLLLPYH